MTNYTLGKSATTGTVHVANTYGASTLRATCGEAFVPGVRVARPLLPVPAGTPVTCKRCLKHRAGWLAPAAPAIPADAIPCGNADVEHPGYPCRHRASDAMVTA